MCQSCAATVAPEAPLTADSIFALDRAASIARELLEANGAPDLTRWSRVTKNYRAAKAALIRALDEQTGRRVIPVKRALTPRQQREAWRTALSDSVFKRRPVSRPAPGEPNELPPVAERFENQCRSFGNSITNEDCAANSVQAESPLTALKDVRRGMKLGRALGAYLRSKGADNDTAAQIVDYVTTRAAAKPIAGHIVISANILDILSCSENSSYRSCHRFNGEYRAGPQQYLHDDHTLTVYYFEEERSFHGHKMPFKLFRQMMYIDQERGGAALMRHYGCELPEDVHESIRREIALLLARLKGQQGEPKWFRKDAPGLSIHQGANLAYVDGCVETVQLVSGHEGRPQIQLAESVPCGACGSDMDEQGQLVCSECAESGEECHGCGRRVSEDEAHGDSDGYTYCDSCYMERYTSCERCGTELYREGEEVYTCPNGEDRCERCFNRSFCHCAECSEAISRDDAHHPDDDSGPLCDSCHEERYSDCADCDTEFANDDLTDGACPECAAKRERAALLLPRLLASPRFARLSPVSRYLLCATWENVTDLSSDDEDCAEPIYRRA